jgi:Skp family chaperone for outer membrane proteins
MTGNRGWVVVLIGGTLGLALWVGQSMGQPASSAPAADAGRVAVVDVVRIFNECAQIKDLNDKMKQDSDDFTKEANQRRKVIEDKQIALGAFTPGTSDYESRRKELIRLNIEANVWLKVTEQGLDQEKFDWTRIIYQQTVAAAGEVARERGIELVLQSSEFRPLEIEQSIQALRRVIQDRPVLYSAAQADITDAVIRRLDRNYQAAGGKKQLSPTLVPLPKPQP